MLPMYEKINAYVQMHHMLGQSDIVIAGISGGPDSVCLLCMLEMLSGEIGFRIVCVHVNHGLRGESADHDEAFVRRLCEERGIRLSVVREDVAAYAKAHGLSCEEAGRKVRRAAFRDAFDRYGGTKIALAHHMDDDAETVLLNLARGTGLKGLAGIRPVAGVYIRPLLAVRKTEILAYLKEREIPYCEDETNAGDAYTRNRIRNHVMPYLEAEINRKTAEHIHQLAGQMEELDRFMERQTDALWEVCVTEETPAERASEKGARSRGFRIDIEGLLAADEALRPYLIGRVISCAAGSRKDIEAVHLKAVEELAGRQSGKSIRLPYGLEAVGSYGGIRIGRRKTPSVTTVRGRIRTRIRMREELPDTFPEDPYTKWFDYDIIQGTVVLRGRMPGDYLDIDCEGHRQKLGRYFINCKVPEEVRDTIPVVAAGSEILWVVGYRQNQKYQISDATVRVLEIRFDEEAVS